MARTIGVTTLDDAHGFRLEAKGLPTVPSAFARNQRSLRACILLSWVAVEDGLDIAIKLWEEKRQVFGPLPSSLKQKIDAVLQTVHRSPVDEAQYRVLRRIRNDLTHPKASKADTHLTLQNAEVTFQFCCSILRELLPYQLLIDF